MTDFNNTHEILGNRDSDFQTYHIIIFKYNHKNKNKNTSHTRNSKVWPT